MLINKNINFKLIPLFLKGKNKWTNQFSSNEKNAKNNTTTK